MINLHPPPTPRQGGPAHRPAAGGPGPATGTAELDLATAARMPAEAVLRELGTSADGLSSAQAAERLRLHGPNVLRAHHVTAAAILLRQFRNPLMLLLLACAAVSGFTGDATDAIIIAAIVAVSVVLSFLNEYRAEVAVEALHAQIRHRAVAWRDGRQQPVDTAAPRTATPPCQRGDRESGWPAWEMAAGRGDGGTSPTPSWHQQANAEPGRPFDRPSRSPHGVAQMTTEQMIADATEDGNIRRYRESGPRSCGSVRLVTLTCGACGSAQPVPVQRGMRMAAFSCDSCHRRTAAWCEGR